MLIQKNLTLFIIIIITHQMSAQGNIFKDEFNSPCTFPDWTFVNDSEGWNASQFEAIDISQTHPGQLMMMPYTCAWYQDRRGPLMYQLISGDFIFTTKVTSLDRDLTNIPESQYSLAGVMVRTPKALTNAPTGWATGEEDYIFLSTGFAATNHPSCQGCAGPHFEVKNTTNGNSSLQVSPVNPGEIEIRIIRREVYILVLKRELNEDWEVHRRYFRSDFPDEIQVGLVTYTDWIKVTTYSVQNHNQYTLNSDLDPNLSNNPSIPFHPDIIARFDYARIDSLIWPDSLNNLNLTNENVVSDDDILAVVGYDEAAEFDGHIWQGQVNGDVMNVSNWLPASIPGPNDAVYIPKCDCVEVFAPVLASGTWEIGRLILDPGAEIDMTPNATLIVRE